MIFFPSERCKFRGMLKFALSLAPNLEEFEQDTTQNLYHMGASSPSSYNYVTFIYGHCTGT